jgi:hypothetical protein
MEEAIAAADGYYQTPPLPTQNFASSGKAAPHLQRTMLVGNLQATKHWRHNGTIGERCCCWDDRRALLLLGRIRQRC